MMPSDAAARQAALDTSASIILQAPAGSGKTTILTQRFLALLTTVETPESVLAMTFTRKAAAEMRGRIIDALMDASASAPPKDAVQAETRALAQAAMAHGGERGWQLQDNPARLRILTIDGLNRQLAAALPIGAAGFGDLQVAQHPDRILLEAARATLIDAENDAAMGVHSDRVLRHLGNAWSRAEELLAFMLAGRSRWLRYIMREGEASLPAIVERNLQAVSDAEITLARAALGADLIAEGARLAAIAIDALGQSGRTSDAEFIRGAELAIDGDVSAMRALARFALTKSSSSVRKTVNVAIGFPQGSPHIAAMRAWLGQLAASEPMTEALLRLRDIPDARFDADSAATIDSLLRLLKYAAQQLVRHFGEIARSDYVQIAAAARQLFGEDGPPSELVLHQGETLRHLLIDEFQDTSLDQIELLEGLTREWVTGDGRTLFVVGDPMQSIYQFRDAEVGLFLRVRDRGLGSIRLRSLALTQNFRSQSAIVDFVNTTFSKVFPHRDEPVEGAVRYLACEAAAKVDPLPAQVRWHLFDDDDEYRRREADAVLEIVRDTRSEKPDASIAVLIGTREQAREIVVRLRRVGFTVRGVDLLPLAESPVVQELIALTRALQSPADRLAWLAVLRASWCGISLQDLTLLVDDAPQSTIPQLCSDATRLARLSSEGRAAVADLFDRLEPWRHREGRDPLAHASLALRVEAAWLRLDGPGCHADLNALKDARRFFDTLTAEIESGDWAGADDFEWMLKGLYAASDGAVDAVQVMTIHRSKGLEFDCVILPGLGRPPRADQPPMLDLVECVTDHGVGGEDRRLLMAPIRAADAARSSLSTFLQKFRARRARRERLRVLYVATTRARRRLHCLGHLTVTKSRGLGPAKHSPLDLLWPAVSEAALAAHGTATPPTPYPNSVQSLPEQVLLHRLVATRSPTPWPKNVEVMRLPISSGELEARGALDFAVAGELARTVGVVVHRELERLASLDALPDVGLVVQAGKRYAAALRAEGLENAQIDVGVARVIEAVQKTLTDERGRWVLGHHQEARVEWALTGVYEGVIASVVIDRCFVDAGVRWVIDYKTSTHEGAGLKEFLLAQAERYTPQLRRYVAFARQFGVEPVRGALYFPLLGHFQEIEL